VPEAVKCDIDRRIGNAHSSLNEREWRANEVRPYVETVAEADDLWLRLRDGISIEIIGTEPAGQPTQSWTSRLTQRFA